MATQAVWAHLHPSSVKVWRYATRAVMVACLATAGSSAFAVCMEGQVKQCLMANGQKSTMECYSGRWTKCGGGSPPSGLPTSMSAQSAHQASVSAGTVQPAFDLSGAWQGDTGGAASYFQEGTALTFINITGGFTHHFVGRYISPTKIEGIQHRVNRVDRCNTEMLLTLTATDSNAVAVWSKVLDSSCDLAKGQILTGSAARTL
jgi:hypothetical protein